MTTRRSFMQMIGLAPAAAAASALPDGIVGIAPSEVPMGSLGLSNAVPNHENPIAKSIARQWFRSNGLPDEIIERWKHERIQNPHYMKTFDADIQTAKSFSLATKRRMQIERLVERELEKEFSRWDFEGFQEMFRAKFGVGVPLNVW